MSFNPKNLVKQTVECFDYTDIPLSDEAKEAICNSSNITFGDATHSLHKVSKLRAVLIDYDEYEEDVAILDSIMELYGNNALIDMES